MGDARVRLRETVPLQGGGGDPGPDRAPGRGKSYAVGVPWTVVIPVRAPGKTRLGRGEGFARAIALDTIEAAAASGARVIVVTADPEVAAQAPAEVVREQVPSGIGAAIALGLPASGDRAVLLGDLPALRAGELAAALADAAGHERAFVADADGTGSTLVTARAGSAFVHRFGAGSADAHRELGLAELDVPAESGLRRDVDLEQHLTLLRPRLGPRTTALVE